MVTSFPKIILILTEKLLNDDHKFFIKLISLANLSEKEVSFDFFLAWYWP